MSQSESVRLQVALDRLAAGDAAARDDLIAAACARLERLARKMLRDYPGVRRWEETGDVFQDAAVRLHRALATVRPAGVLDFYRLAALQVRRVLIDLARHHYGPEGGGANHASGIARPDQSGDGPPPAHEGADQSLDGGRLAAWTEFHAAIDRLPEEERAVTDLLFYQGLSQEEAAEVLGVTDRTVRQRWRDARIRLREWLGDGLPGM